MNVQFSKYHGTGNDFILIDGRGLDISGFEPGLIRQICHRRFGIGGDGLIILQESEKADFRMRYYNADGYEGTMCGNGGRCITAFANRLGMINMDASFEGIDGIHTSTIMPDEEIRLKLTKFIKDNRDKDNLSIFQKYLFFHLISRNKYGFFDSIYGSKKSFGLYTDPYVFEESLKRKPEFLFNKKLQKHFFIKKAKEICSIPTQDANVPISLRDGSTIFHSLLYFISFVVRGSGLRYATWAKQKSYQKFSKQVLLTENDLFYNHFNIEKIMRLTKYDMRMYEDIVKYKQILDIIKTKGYKAFFKK